MSTASLALSTFAANQFRIRSKCTLVYKATRQHARNLGLFALGYKTTMLFLRHTSPTGKERHYDSFLAGLLGGYTVFGRTIHNSVSQQIVIYVFARVCLALAKLAVQPRHVAGTQGGGGGWELFGDGEMRRSLVRNGWPAFASLSWAMVMYLFRWHPESVQSSLRSSMSYMCVKSAVCLGEFANEKQLCAIRSLGFATNLGVAQQIALRSGAGRHERERATYGWVRARYIEKRHMHIRLQTLTTALANISPTALLSDMHLDVLLRNIKIIHQLFEMNFTKCMTIVGQKPKRFGSISSTNCQHRFSASYRSAAVT